METYQLEFDFDSTTENINEELTTIVVDGILIKEYSISKNGNLYSHIRQTRKTREKNGFIISYDPTIIKLLKPRTIGGYSRADIYLSNTNPLFNYDYARQRKTCLIHKLVLDSWKPFEQYLPECINKDDYVKTPESIKNLLKELFLINHIDHNKLNNKLENLERVTHKENSRSAQKFYNNQNNQEELD